jgi:hypothetical protein
MTTLPRQSDWWYWAVTALLLIVGLAGRFEAFYLAAVVSAVQVVHFRLREGAFAAFPVQVRVVFTATLLLALWKPMNWLFWVPAIGTPAQVLFGYCALARCLSLLPWNRSDPLSWRLVWRTFASPPVKGNIMQGQAATPQSRVARPAGQGLRTQSATDMGKRP